MYLKTGDPGRSGGGTLTGTSTEPTIDMYENIFGPAGRDVKQDSQRHKRHQRWHLPDALKGHNQYLTDRIDGLITDATSSPFTRNILPYVYLEQPDQKLKWNVYSFDEGIASRVPYEAAARVLPQTKRSFAGYTVRQGLAIAMEHNFMVSAAGRENFKNQLTQLVGSIQLTNDLDVHIALLQAPSYQKFMNEKYHDQHKTTAQICREHVDLFGIMQKVPNALDILIEDAKNNLKTWGSPAPSFMLCNGALTTQMTMLPEKTNYLTNGPDGKQRLAQGPDLPSYRGLSIIHSRKFSMDAGSAPRDLLRRRVRVAEYYHIPWTEKAAEREYEFYDQSRDTMFRLSWKQLMAMASMSGEDGGDGMDDGDGGDGNGGDARAGNDFWSEGPQSRRRITRVPGVALAVADGGLLPSTAHVTTMVRQPIGGPFHYAESKPTDGGLLLPPVITCHDAPRCARQVPLKMTACKPGRNVNYPSSKCFRDGCERQHTQSETFGGGLFRDPFQIDQARKRFPVLYNTNDDQCLTMAKVLASTFFEIFHGAHYQNALSTLVVPTVTIGAREYRLLQVVCDQIIALNPQCTSTAELRALGLASADLFNTAFDNAASLNPTEAGDPLLRSLMREVGVVDGGPGAFDVDQVWHETTAENRLIHTVQYCNSCAGYDRLKALISGDFDPAVDYQERQHVAAMLPDILMAFVLDSRQIEEGDPARYEQEARNNPVRAQKCLLNCIQAVVDGTEPDPDNLVTYSLPPTPNLHIQTCTELRAEDARKSASSLEPVAWVVQHVAGMVSLEKDTCECMLKTDVYIPMAADPPRGHAGQRVPQGQALLDTNNYQHVDAMEYIEFLTSEGSEHWAEMAASKPVNSFLMHCVMSYFHPSEAVRDRARARCAVPSFAKENMLEAFADAIHSNSLDGAAATKINEALCGLVAAQFSYTGTEACTAEADSHRRFMPAYVDQDSRDILDQKAALQALPVDNVERFGRITARLDALTNEQLLSTYSGCVKKPLSNRLVDQTHTADPAAEYYDAAQRRFKRLFDDAPAGYMCMSALPLCVARPWTALCADQMGTSQMLCGSGQPTDAPRRPVTSHDAEMAGHRRAAEFACRDPAQTERLFQHVILVLAARFFEDARRFVDNGAGLGVNLASTPGTGPRTPHQVVGRTAEGQLKNDSPLTLPAYARLGCHLSHGPGLPRPTADDGAGGPRQDIVILRPNIEHEMLGVIMGRGGTQELGSTFWGQTELSCYDDAQHGIWGMSYKYHERAMVTNERNLIRVFDVAFDGYNGGMDQQAVDWNDPRSRQAFRDATYARDRPYNGPSMLVMALPHNPAVTRCNWPNPVLFHNNFSGNPTPDPQKDDRLPDIEKHMVFNSTTCPALCSPAQHAAYDRYMTRLEMPIWASLDQSSRPAGDCCIANESSANMLAFQGTMKVYDAGGACVDHIQGSGHLGPSYVGVASVREGRGILNTNMQPQMIRQI